MNRAIFFAEIRKTLFPRGLDQSQVDGVNAILDAVEKAHTWADAPMLAYPLATVFHETAKTMQPIEEYGRGHGHPYGRPTGPFHKIYYGRGLVQLTWLAGYTKATVQLRAHGVIGADVDLVKNPELALRPDIAAAVLIYGLTEGWFTGKKLADYIHPSGYADYVNARRMVNGTDKAVMIAGYARDFEKAIRAAA
jgi:putative chitinase